MHHESRCADPDLSPMPLSVVIPVHDDQVLAPRAVPRRPASFGHGRRGTSSWLTTPPVTTAAVATPMGARAFCGWRTTSGLRQRVTAAPVMRAAIFSVCRRRRRGCAGGPRTGRPGAALTPRRRRCSVRFLRRRPRRGWHRFALQEPATPLRASRETWRRPRSGRVRRDPEGRVRGRRWLRREAIPAPLDRGHRSGLPAPPGRLPILLDTGLQATHLKRWTFRSLLHTDVMLRALPWSRLSLESGAARGRSESEA